MYLYNVYNIYICNHENNLPPPPPWVSPQWIFMGSHALGQMMYGYTLLVPMRAH